MSVDATAPVALLAWDGSPVRTVQDAVWKLEDRDDSTNRLSVTTSLAEADGVESEQELIFKGRRFSVAEVDRDRDQDRAVIHADEVQAELADLILVNFSSNSWTLEQATEAALSGTRWTLGQINGIRYGRAHFEDISRLDALKFLARHQDSRLSFDSLNRRVNITATAGTIHETVFTYGRQLTNIEKQESAPTCTVIYPTGADGMKVTGAVLDNGQTFGQNFVEDYGYYTSKGLTLAQARSRYKKEDYWEDNRYEVPENMLRDAQKRLAEEAYPQISYTLTAAVTYSEDDGTPEVDDFGISELALGDQVYVWDQEIDAKLRAEVTAITTSSDSSENQVTLSYLPDSLGAGVEGRYFGDSGSVSNGDRGRSGFQPRPSMPILESVTDVGSGLVRWNGQDHDGNYDTIPARFGSVETVVAKLEADGSIPSPDSDGAFGGTRIDTRGGGVSSIGFGGAGDFAVWFYMLGRDAQTRSEYSEPLVVEVTALVDMGYINGVLETERERVDEATGQLEAGQEELTGNLTELAGRQDQLQLDLQWVGLNVAEFEVRIDNAQAGADSARATAEELENVTLPALEGRLLTNETAVAEAEDTLTDTRLNMENLRDVALPGLQDDLDTGLEGANEWRDVGAISATSLRVGNWDNMITSPDFVDEWDVLGGWRFVAGTTAADMRTPVWAERGVRVLRPAERQTGIKYVRYGQHRLAVQPGDSHRFRARKFGGNIAGNRLGIRVGYEGEHAGVIWHAPEHYWSQSIPEDGELAYEWTVPDVSTIRSMFINFYFDIGAPAGWNGIYSPSLRSMTDGRLIVDGSVQARHIMAESVAAAVGEFLQIEAHQIDTENLAAFLATIIELDAGQITSGKISTSRLDAETVAGAVANFLTLDALEINFEQLAGEIADVIQLTSDSIAARTIQAKHLAIGNWANLITDPSFQDEWGIPGGWEIVDGGPDSLSPAYWAAQGTYILRPPGTYDGFAQARYGDQRIQARAGETYRFSAKQWESSDSNRSLGIRVGYYDDMGLLSWHTPTRYDWPAQSSRSALNYEWTVPDVDSIRTMFVQLVFYRTATSGHIGIYSPSVTLMTTSELLVDGAVKARSLDVEEVFTNSAVINKVWADVVRSRLVESRGIITEDMIATGAITTPKLTVTESMAAQFGQFIELEAGFFKSNEIRSMSVIGGTVEGATLRGNLIETHSQNNRGVKLDNSGIRAWDSGGNQRFNLSSSTGNMTATGIFRTGFSGDLAQLDSDTFGGRLSFYRGSRTGTLKLNNSLDRLEMVFSDGSNPNQERPNVGVTETNAIVGYRQTQILVGGTTVDNQGIRVNGSFKGDVFFDDYIQMARGARVRYYDNLNRYLATVGQSPGSGSSSDFQIWLERGALRVANGGMFLPSAYTTTSSTSANVYISSSGWLSRATSASRYKLDQQELTVPDTVLDVPVIDWIDKAATEFKAEMDAKPRPLTEKEQAQCDTINLRRIPGVVAETVVEYGGEQFVVYGADGQVEEVMYDRLGLAQIQVLKRIVKDQGERIAALEGAA